MVFGSKTKKIAAKFATVGFKPSSTNISNLESRDTSTAHARRCVYLRACFCASTSFIHSNFCSYFIRRWLCINAAGKPSPTPGANNQIGSSSLCLLSEVSGSSRVSLLDSATHCNTLQHTATHCNTLQHTATHCNTLQQWSACTPMCLLSEVSSSPTQPLQILFLTLHAVVCCQKDALSNRIHSRIQKI